MKNQISEKLKDVSLTDDEKERIVHAFSIVGK